RGYTQCVSLQLSLQLGVEASRTVRSGFAHECGQLIGARARPQTLGGNVACNISQAVFDEVTREDKGAAVLMTSAKDDVRMRIVGVMVINGHPLKARATQARLGACHDVPHIRFEISNLDAVLSGENDAEVSAVFPCPDRHAGLAVNRFGETVIE